MKAEDSKTGLQHNNSRRWFAFGAGLALAMVLWGTVSAADVRESLRRRIEGAGTPVALSVNDEIIFASAALPLFYERNTYRPVWVDDDGPLPRVDVLLGSIMQIRREGLRPEDYHLARIRAVRTAIIGQVSRGLVPTPGQLVDLELLCTDAFLICGSHLLSGRINPETIDAEWYANRREADLAAVLEAAVGVDRVDSCLLNLLPPQPGYGRLREALARYRRIAEQGGWQAIPTGPKLKVGDSGDRVALLRERLAATGDLESAPYQSREEYDEGLLQAVKQVQKRYGLDVDGVVGSATLEALNVPVADRIEELAINLERWRWLPQDLGQKHVLVNIANFELEEVRDGQIVEDMRVIVGKSYRRTPVFSDRITYIVINPYWEVPRSLTVNDVLAAIRKDPGFLKDNGFELLTGWGGDSRPVNPDSIDWKAITPRQFVWRLRQTPGPKNLLGRIKFMFPNQFNVYLHDTPARELFSKSSRDFSSGCIRVERPIDLATFLLEGSRKWDRFNLMAAIEKQTEQTVRLPEPVPVHILYWTAWVTEDGKLNFRRDVYERDRPLADALREEPPGLD